MSLHFEIAGAQIDGARDYQEDAFLVTNLIDYEGEASAMVVVADGMGGHAAGNVASNMAVQAFNKHITTNYPSKELNVHLQESATNANNSIAETIKETPALNGMGCTMVGTVLENNQIWWVSVGDSHLYLLRDNKLTKLNEDHSYGGFLDRMKAAGTPVEAEKGLSRNMLMSALVGEDISEVDCPGQPFKLKPNDIVIVCSDGMDTLKQSAIVEDMDWSASPRECVEALMGAVKTINAPKQDNTTAVVIKVGPDKAKSQLKEIEASIENVAADTPFEPAAPSEPEYAREGKGKGGLILGIVVGFLAIAGTIGVYFFLFAPDTSPVPPQVEDSKPLDIAEEEIMIDDEAVAEIEEELIEEEEEELIEEEIVEEEIVETETPSEKTVKAEVESRPEEKAVAVSPTAEAPAETVSSKEFQDPLQNGNLGPIMISLSGGSYEMGSKATSQIADERPRHTVNIKRFAMSKYEVTFSEYELYAQATKAKIFAPPPVDKRSYPITYVSWDDAYNYAQWLSRETGKKYRLPNESEWEYAAAAGKNNNFWWGFKEEPNKAHCFDCGSPYDPRNPTKIAAFEPNGFSLYDTAGNVAEWVQDCWHKNYNNAPTDGSVWQGGECSLRGVRGGAYTSPLQSLRIAKRDKLKSNARYDHVGIRLVRELE